MISKIYPSGCEVRRDKCQPVIVITHDEYTFSFNDGPDLGGKKMAIHFAPESKGRGIMVSEFLLPFSRLNISSLSELSHQDLVERRGLTETEIVEIFEFGKNNQGYWTGADLFFFSFFFLHV